ncbi:DegQ family serine endoprotease [Thiohalobacter sp. IOR34]|uniref:DegQ family serine endoprotease n=1 Tax=Thiohalobacter sp. IOR34 TaxID=3057176 RepID=UPI0025AEF4C7|nr:DegQ family serine endoprotease [Thiohalobacter sp. IOR34]WJW76364.1 DegQ family serine endoprotease [Thiohalobacter sp. IOR34]
MKPYASRFFASLFSLLFVLWAQAASGALPALLQNAEGKPSLAPMLKQVMPAVVNISTRSRVRVPPNPLLQDPLFRRFFGIPDTPQERERTSLGSGVIVDAAKGFIITNHHVIDQADEITVTLRDKRRLEARVVGTDPEADLAVIQIEARGLRDLPMADSSKLEVGDFVVAIGNPFGLQQTVTSGIVSALGRSGLGIEGYENFIQTDASINPGNSGGALVDLDGRLVGINTAIVGPSGGNVGIGFAIPSNMVNAIMRQLIRYGEVRRGQLGVMAQDLTPELAEALKLSRRSGAVITQVIKGSAAEQAGLRSGDVVVEVNGKPVKSSADLRNTIGLLPVGSELRLKIIRDGKPRRLRATIARPRQEQIQAGKLSPYLEGAVLGNLTPDHPLAGKVQGIEIVEVEPGSRAWAAGLRPGDVIVSINRQPVSDLEEAEKALRAARQGVLLNVLRGDGAFFLVIR